MQPQKGQEKEIRKKLEPNSTYSSQSTDYNLNSPRHPDAEKIVKKNWKHDFADLKKTKFLI